MNFMKEQKTTTGRFGARVSEFKRGCCASSNRVDKISDEMIYGWGVTVGGLGGSFKSSGLK